MKQPHLLVTEGDIHDTVLLPGDPGRVEEIADRLDDVEQITYNREFRVVNGEYQGKEITICSTGVGSPSAAVAVEELIRAGAETLIRVGTTGALQRHIDEGDLVVPTGAAKFEGTTKRYEGVEFPAVPSLDVTNALVDEVKNFGSDFHVGPIVTDDAFYAEDEPAFDWEDAGMVSVEMEASCIFTLARRNGLRSGAILSVDGNLVLGEQKGETESDEELSSTAREGVEAEIEIALNAAHNL